MVRPGEDDLGGAELHQAPEVEDGDPIGHVPHDAEIVGDEEVGDLLLCLEFDEQVEDRSLHRHIQRRRRLVANDELRVAREGAGDREPLLEASRQLPRTLAHVSLGEAHRTHQLEHSLLGRTPGRPR